MKNIYFLLKKRYGQPVTPQFKILQSKKNKKNQAAQVSKAKIKMSKHEQIKIFGPSHHMRCGPRLVKSSKHTGQVDVMGLDLGLSTPAATAIAVSVSSSMAAPPET